MSAPRITCLFHSSATVTALLDAPAGRALAGELLVECALRPALGFVLNLETPANYPGVAGLLGNVDVGSLAHSTDNLPVPILLAAGMEVAPGAVRAAISLLGRPEGRLHAVTLLVPFSDARALGAALAVCDRFAIAWDVAEFPHEELLDFARWLGSERLIDRGNFFGVLAYAREPLEPAHAQRVAALLAPLATPGAPSEVIVTGP